LTGDGLASRRCRRGEIGDDSRNVTARELPSGERENLFGRITELAPGFAEYQAKTTRVIPVFELQPAS
jgi:F420H(2)-dependent quinone reductase